MISVCSYICECPWLDLLLLLLLLYLLCFFLLRQGLSTYPWLSLKSLCRPGWTWTHRFTCLCLAGAEIKDFKNTFDHKTLFYGAHAQASSIIHVALMQNWLRTVTCVYPLLPRTLDPLHHEGCTASFTVSESNTSILLIYVHYYNMPHHPVTFIFMV